MSLGSPANRGIVGELESLGAIRCLYAPAVPVAPTQAICRPHAAHRPLESSRRAAPRPWSVTTPSTTSAESGGMQPALLTDQIVEIFLDETLVAIDAPSAWTRRPVA